MTPFALRRRRLSEGIRRLLSARAPPRERGVNLHALGERRYREGLPFTAAAVFHSSSSGVLRPWALDRAAAVRTSGLPVTMDGVSTDKYEEHLNLRRPGLLGFVFMGFGAGLTLLIQCSFQLLQLPLQSCSQEPSRLSATRAIVEKPSHSATRMSMSLSKQEYAREEKAKDKVREHTCGVDPPLLLNETKVRIFMRLLGTSVMEPNETVFWSNNLSIRASVQREWRRSQSRHKKWWVQHVQVEPIQFPWCYAPWATRFRGHLCPRYNDRTALVKCSSAVGANREAAPKAPGQWFSCLAVLNGLLAARNTLVLSFGIALDFAFDDQMASLGFTVHGSDPTRPPNATDSVGSWTLIAAICH